METISWQPIVACTAMHVPSETATSETQLEGSGRSLLATYGYADWEPHVSDSVPATWHYPEFEGGLGWLTVQDCAGCQAGRRNPGYAFRLSARKRGLAG